MIRHAQHAANGDNQLIDSQLVILTRQPNGN
ncbi:hypothetical protein J2125_002915 [Erwinia toletana]|uniref:Uncharacterized protein n=1 Tax=Winslowiella toletana TaxID=92490 RepID=A0ABS4PCR6_9GAMM|nr:hypothetical protein [Winslowiella toletana]